MTHGRFLFLSNQKKRGISSIVGAVFFIVLMGIGFSVYFLAIDTQIQVVDTQKLVADTEKKKSQEDFKVVASTNSTDNNRLGVGILNSSPGPIEIVDIWMYNKSSPASPSQRFEIDPADAYIPSGFSLNILENSIINLANLTQYEIKAVSSLGTTRTTTLNVGSGDALLAELVTIPPNPVTGEIITVILYVINTGESTILDVTPRTMVTDIDPGITITEQAGFPKPPSTDLEPNDMIFFIWKYKIVGSENLSVNFTNSANGTESILGYEVQSNEDSDQATIINPSPGSVGFDTLSEGLLNKPGIFMVIPGPFGNSSPDNGDDRALWGMNIVNPTPNTMDVSRVTISTLTPRSEPADEFFGSPGGNYCGPITLKPNSGAFDCQEDNQLIWTDTIPFSIPPFSAQEFIAMVKPGDLRSSSVQLDTVIVHGHVQTSIGEFGKAGYATSMASESMGLVNLYLTSEVNSVDTSKISTVVLGIKNATSQQFNVTLADFENDSGGGGPQIKKNQTITINIPRLWNLTGGEAAIETFGVYEATLQPFFDGTSQITAIFNGTTEIDGISPAATTIQFNLTAPSVTSTKLWVMWILADGEMEKTGSYDMDISPLAEVILQVEP